MKIARIVFGAVVVMAGIAGVVLTTQQAGGEFLAFISAPDKLVSWGPLLTAFLTALGGIALAQGILSKSASREQVEELGEKIERSAGRGRPARRGGGRAA